MSLQYTYVKINFLERYRALSNAYDMPEKSLRNFSVETVSSIINGLGYEAKFFKSERFFRITSVANGYEFWFHIVLTHGIAEMMIYIKDGKDYLNPCGPFSKMSTEIGLSQEARIKPPVFSNYEELAKILEEGLSIYEDVKKEFLEFLSTNRNA